MQNVDNVLYHSHGYFEESLKKFHGTSAAQFAELMQNRTL
jgi:uncharacterized protein YbgA (DUF1722 family)